MRLTRHWSFNIAHADLSGATVFLQKCVMISFILQSSKYCVTFCAWRGPHVAYLNNDTIVPVGWLLSNNSFVRRDSRGYSSGRLEQYHEGVRKLSNCFLPRYKEAVSYDLSYPVEYKLLQLTVIAGISEGLPVNWKSTSTFRHNGK